MALQCSGKQQCCVLTPQVEYMSQPCFVLSAHLQIMILAWPGVVVTFILIAICGRYFFPYGWTWPQALLFGAMLSATDPVAVVAVLHEVVGDCGEGVV
jgi:NhaP-type Na+/H+ and K+/H+ antiporter